MLIVQGLEDILWQTHDIVSKHHLCLEAGLQAAPLTLTLSDERVNRQLLLSLEEKATKNVHTNAWTSEGFEQGPG